jgi:hypothetical protein
VLRPRLEVADIFRAHGPAWRQANAGHVSLTQLKVMAAIEACRTDALGGPEAVLAYLSRYTHRVAISNTRLIRADAETVAFRWKDYCINSVDRRRVMRLATDEFIRRFLIHVLPDGFHRIRHYGLLASAARKANIAKIRVLLGAAHATAPPEAPADPVPLTLREPCPCCGGQMRIVEIFRRGQQPQSRAPPRERAA